MQDISEAPPLDWQAGSPSSRLVKSSRSQREWGLVSCGGVGAFLFTTTYLHGTLHSSLVWVLIPTLELGYFTFAQYTRLLLHWGRFVYSLMTGILILIFWEAFVLGDNGTIAGLVPLTGLTERLSAGSHAL